MEGPMSKKTNEPPKRANHNGDIKFLNPTSPPVVARSISNKEMGGPSARRPNLDKPSPTATACLKMETSRLHLIFVTPATLTVSQTMCLQVISV
jgi:hypothetical protein